MVKRHGVWLYKWWLVIEWMILVPTDNLLAFHFPFTFGDAVWSALSIIQSCYCINLKAIFWVLDLHIVKNSCILKTNLIYIRSSCWISPYYIFKLLLLDAQRVEWRWMLGKNCVHLLGNTKDLFFIEYFFFS